MNDLFLKPKEGLTVRDPRTGKPLPAAGDLKPRSSYWLRRLRDKDVVQAQPPKAAKATTASKGEGK